MLLDLGPGGFEKRPEDIREPGVGIRSLSGRLEFWFIIAFVGEVPLLLVAGEFAALRFALLFSVGLPPRSLLSALPLLLPPEAEALLPSGITFAPPATAGPVLPPT